jgi:very-short-patch-repair endonuclease
VNARLSEIARGQMGLFTREQATKCGYTAAQIRRRVSTGAWRRVVRNVFSPDARARTSLWRDRARQLAVPGAVLAGPSAARLWGMAVPESPTYLIVDRRVRQPPNGVEIMRDCLTRTEVQTFEGMQLVTSRERTVFDCLRILDESAGLDLLDRALQQGWVTLPELGMRLRRSVGRHGVPRALRAMSRAASGARFSAERRAHALLRRAHITGWSANAPISDAQGVIGLGDIVFDEVKLVIEIDGLAFHVTPDRFQGDRRRQNRLVAAGWTVLRFTWRDLTERPAYVTTTVRTTIDRLVTTR